MLTKNSKCKWRGIYNGNSIEFTMGDEIFKNDVYDKKRAFSNDHVISAELLITTKIDENGNIISTTYRVDTVLGGYDSIEEKEYTTTAGQKRLSEQNYLPPVQQDFTEGFFVV